MTVPVHGELIISRVDWSTDENYFRAVGAFNGDPGKAAWTWRGQGGHRPKSAPQTATAAAPAPPPRAPNLCACQRLLLGFGSFFLNPQRILRSALIVQPSTLLRCHAALKACKYRWLDSRAPTAQARSTRAVGRIDPRQRGMEAAQPPLWLSANRAAVDQSLWDPTQQ